MKRRLHFAPFLTVTLPGLISGTFGLGRRLCMMSGNRNFLCRTHSAFIINAGYSLTFHIQPPAGIFILIPAAILGLFVKTGTTGVAAATGRSALHQNRSFTAKLITVVDAGLCTTYQIRHDDSSFFRSWNYSSQKRRIYSTWKNFPIKSPGVYLLFSSLAAARFSFFLISSVTSSIKASRDFWPSSPFQRLRTETLPSASSFSPTTSIYGSF